MAWITDPYSFCLITIFLFGNSTFNVPGNIHQLMKPVMSQQDVKTTRTQLRSINDITSTSTRDGPFSLSQILHFVDGFSVGSTERTILIKGNKTSTIFSCFCRLFVFRQNRDNCCQFLTFIKRAIEPGNRNFLLTLLNYFVLSVQINAAVFCRAFRR